MEDKNYEYHQVEKCLIAHLEMMHMIKKLLTSLAWDPIGEELTLLQFVWTKGSEVCTATTLGQNSPVWPSRLVSKRLILNVVLQTLLKKINSKIHVHVHCRAHDL